MSAGKGSVARHLSVISAVEVCACPELLLWFIRWLGRKNQKRFNLLLYQAMPNSAIRFGNLTILKFPSIVTTIPTAILKVSMFMHG